MSYALVQHPMNDVLWKEFRSLQSLRFCRIPKLEYLPDGMRHVTTLQDIYIGACPNLITLPKWIGELTTLSPNDLPLSKAEFIVERDSQPPLFRIIENSR